MDVYDYIIVGGGTAGCVLANRLSAQPGARVLMLEDGPSDWNPIIHIPAAVGRAIMSPAISWRYEVEPDASRGGRADIFPCGRTLGGGSSINGLFFSRGQREDFDDWAKGGADGWSFNELLPYFKRIETSEIGDEVWRGRNGLLHVSKLRSIHPLSRVFIAAAEQCGIPATDDYNGPQQAGVSLAQVTQKRGWRHSAAQAYLAPAKQRSNLTVLTGAHVTRLVFDGRRCTGAEFRHCGALTTAAARREVIVAAGAIGSPKVLMLSGLGPAQELQHHGIAPVIDLPGVGANLQEHPDITLSADVNLKTYNIAAREPWTIAAYLARWLAFGDGPATSPFCQAVAFFHSSGNVDARPDLEILFAPFSFERDADGVRPHPQPAVNVIVSLCRPSSRGTVTLRSADPADLPRLKIELIDDRDLPTILAGCRMARRILQAPAFKPYVIAERLPGPQAQTDEELTAHVRQLSFGGNHLVGTCKMGRDEMAVVTPDLKVKGIENLRVIDTSIMPRVISAHTNSVAFVIGERGADLLLGAA